MSDSLEKFDPERTIPGVSEADGGVEDFDKLREEFHIYPAVDGSCYYDLKLLGMGGMGVVFSGSDPTLERDVAVKILREPYRHNREQIAKFINEARITARIDHPNIVAVHQLGVNEHHGVYFSMRRISGETLQSVLRKLREGDPEAEKKYTLERMLDIFIAGCNAVAAAHEKQILHCDLKPANIMIGAFGEVLVLDWGLAREFDTVAEKKNVISGTPAYMAPELVTGTNEAPDVLTDIYALGTILFSILTLHPAPFDMEQDKDILLEKVAGGKQLPLRPPKGGHLPRELAAICRKAMAVDREERYATVTELLNDVYNFRSRHPVQAYSPSIFYRFFKLCRRHPAIPVAVIVAAITMILYFTTDRIIEFAHDRSLMRSASINIGIADNYYRKTIAMRKNNRDDSNTENPLQLVIEERDQQLLANTALMEYFSILDSISAASPAGVQEFAELHAAQIFRRILELAISFDDHDKLNEVMGRCRRWEVFETACRQDSRLNELVSLINAGEGIVLLRTVGETSQSVTIVMPDESRQTIEINGVRALKLKAGFYRIEVGSRMTMYCDIIPGGNNEFTLPSGVADGFYVIPDDHFYLDIPGYGDIHCSMASFALAAEAMNGEFTWEEAQKIMSSGKDVRLPGTIELLKAWSSRDGKPLYMPIPSAGKVWLDNGLLYDIESRNWEKPAPGQKGMIFPVRVIERKND